jgi:hypothetical protein
MLLISADVRAQIAARPETFVATYNGLGGSIAADAYVQAGLGPPFASLAAAACVATFASVVAYNAAPAGTTALDASTATLAQLLAAPALGSAHFCKLSTLLALLGGWQLAPPETPAGTPPKATLHCLVWLDTAPLNAGAHFQLVVTNALDSAYVLLDPMYGCALRIPFVGGGPQADLSVAENVAMMMQAPVAPGNLAPFDSAAASTIPQTMQVAISGVLGPQYVDTQESAFWDRRATQVITNLS